MTKKKRGGGGYPVWTPAKKEATFAAILAEISMGKGLVKICEAPDMPTPATVRSWMREDSELATRYAHAREDQADYLADQILEIADTAEDPNKARVQIESRKWLAAKLKSKSYGEKIAHVGGSEEDSPIRFVDEADAFTRRIAGIAPRVGTGSGAGETEH